MNFTFNPEYYVVASLKEEFWDKIPVPLREVEFSGVRIPIIADCLGFMIITKEKLIDKDNYYQVYFKILETIVNEEAPVEPYSRCFSSLIEMLVYATKIKALRSNLEYVKTRYFPEIESNLEKTLKTCNSRYQALAREIYDWVVKWLREK